MKFSVIIPCHDALPYLGQTLGSVLEQSHPPEEVIVVADACSDGSAVFAARFSPSIQVHETDFGHACQARNYGFRHASGDVFQFLDADDVLHPDAHRHLRRAISRQDEGVALGSWSRLEQRDGTWREYPPSIPPRRLFQNRLSAWLDGRYVPPCAVLWTRRGFLRAGGWDEHIPINQDGHLMMRAFLRGVPVVRAPRSRSYYRRRPAEEGSVSSRRLTEAGIRGQFTVLEEIAAEMQGRHQLGPHRAALHRALVRLEREAIGHPELRVQIGALRAEVAPSAAVRLREALLERSATFARHQWNRVGRRLRRPSPPPVPYGLSRQPVPDPLSSSPRAIQAPPRISVCKN